MQLSPISLLLDLGSQIPRMGYEFPRTLQTSNATSRKMRRKQPPNPHLQYKKLARLPSTKDQNFVIRLTIQVQFNTVKSTACYFFKEASFRIENNLLYFKLYPIMALWLN